MLSPHDPQQRKHFDRRSLGLFVSALILTLTLPLVFKTMPLLFDQMRLVMKLKMLGPWAAALFMGLHIFATMIGMPGVILTIAGGVWFGLIWGTVWSTLGATLGAIGAFGLARSLLHDAIYRRFAHRPFFAKLNQAVVDNPLTFVLMLRFVPISPFNIVNFGLGLTKMDWWSYSLGTLLGIIPGVIAYTWLGVTGHQTLQGGSPIPLAIAGTILALMSAVPMVLKRIKRIAQKETQD